MTYRFTAILLMVVTGLVACSHGDKTSDPLLPDAPGSQVLSQGLDYPFGAVDIGVNAVADGKASLSIVPRATGDSSRSSSIHAVVLAPGQSADIAGTHVTVIAVDDHSKRHRVRVTVEQPTPTPSSTAEIPPSPPSTTTK